MKRWWWLVLWLSSCDWNAAEDIAKCGQSPCPTDGGAMGGGAATGGGLTGGGATGGGAMGGGAATGGGLTGGGATGGGATGGGATGGGATGGGATGGGATGGGATGGGTTGGGATGGGAATGGGGVDAGPALDGLVAGPVGVFPADGGIWLVSTTLDAGQVSRCIRDAGCNVVAALGPIFSAYADAPEVASLGVLVEVNAGVRRLVRVTETGETGYASSPLDTGATAVTVYRDATANERYSVWAASASGLQRTSGAWDAGGMLVADVFCEFRLIDLQVARSGEGDRTIFVADLINGCPTVFGSHPAGLGVFTLSSTDVTGTISVSNPLRVGRWGSAGDAGLVFASGLGTVRVDKYTFNATLGRFDQSGTIAAYNSTTLEVGDISDMAFTGITSSPLTCQAGMCLDASVPTAFIAVPNQVWALGETLPGTRVPVAQVGNRYAAAFMRPDAAIDVFWTP